MARAAAPDAAQDAAASECEQDDMAAAIAEQRFSSHVGAPSPSRATVAAREGLGAPT